MMITFADNGDGTGGVVTVSGTGGSAINRLYISRFAGTNRSRTFELAGTRTGDGTITVAAETGPFLAMLTSATESDIEFTDPIVFRVTNSEVPLHYRVCEAIREFMLDLALPALPTDPELHVIAKVGAKFKELIGNNDSIVFYIPSQEVLEFASNSDSTVSYPVDVVIHIKSGNTLRINIREIMLSREIAAFSLKAEPLPDLPEIHTVNVQPNILVDPSKWALNYDVSVITFVALTERNEIIT